MTWYSNLTTTDLVSQLQKANWAYHNSEEIMSDDAYDRGLEELRKRSPAHPFLEAIGAPPAKSAILLPYVMGSQDKVRAGEGSLERWMKRYPGKYVSSDKLDGLSALFVTGSKKLYLRGDGVHGVDVSKYLTNLHGNLLGLRAKAVVRGELILPTASTPAGSIGRSLVNGWMHRTPAAPELKNVHFVAYQVLEPAGMTRSQQMTWLTANGYEVPWWSVGPVSEDLLKESLVRRKAEGIYPLDGIVVGADGVPEAVESRNPSDSVAFKMSLDEQKEETRVVAVEWNLSRQGMWIPRIQIEPVCIGGANIQWLSGHNASAIEAGGIGPGARIIVRRSGDVIPTLDTVLEAVEAAMPAKDTWEWDRKRTHAMALEGTANKERTLLHALQTLEVDGIGPGLVSKMIEGGITTMKDLWSASEKKLAFLGPGRAASVVSGLRKSREKASMCTLLIASNLLPRGVGTRKLRTLFDVEGDPRKWSGLSIGKRAGWTEESLGELLKVLPAALSWIDQSFPGFVGAGPAVPAAPVGPAGPAAPAASKFVVFTGVRDKELEAKLVATGWAIQDSVNAKTTVVVTDEAMKESAKVKKARELGKKILRLSEFRLQC